MRHAGKPWNTPHYPQTLTKGVGINALNNRNYIDVSFEAPENPGTTGPTHLSIDEASIVDVDLTRVVDGQLVSVSAWYDNEWGFANRLLDTSVYWSRVSARTEAVA